MSVSRETNYYSLMDQIFNNMMAGGFTKNVFRILTVYVRGLILGATTKAMVMVMAMSPVSK